MRDAIKIIGTALHTHPTSEQPVKQVTKEFLWDWRTAIEAGVAGVQWVHRQCQALGSAHSLAVVADGAYDTKLFWQGLPAGVLACVRVDR